MGSIWDHVSRMMAAMSSESRLINNNCEEEESKEDSQGIKPWFNHPQFPSIDWEKNKLLNEIIYPKYDETELDFLEAQRTMIDLTDRIAKEDVLERLRNKEKQPIQWKQSKMRYLNLLSQYEDVIREVESTFDIMCSHHDPQFADTPTATSNSAFWNKKRKNSNS